MKPRVIECDLYGVDISFLNGWPEENVRKEYGIELAGDVGCFEDESPKGLVIWCRKKNDLPTIVHECLHAALFILGRAGVKFSADNNECLAYLVEWLFVKCTEKK